MAKKDSEVVIAPLPSPLPQAGEGIKAKETSLILVAYHAGPDAIGFYGMDWQRDGVQAISRDDWAAMQARGDFDEFNFTEEK